MKVFLAVLQYTVPSSLAREWMRTKNLQSVASYKVYTLSDLSVVNLLWSFFSYRKQHRLNQAERWVDRVALKCVSVCAVCCVLRAVWCSFPTHLQMWVHLNFDWPMKPYGIYTNNRIRSYIAHQIPIHNARIEAAWDVRPTSIPVDNFESTKSNSC